MNRKVFQETKGYSREKRGGEGDNFIVCSGMKIGKETECKKILIYRK